MTRERRQAIVVTSDRGLAQRLAGCLARAGYSSRLIDTFSAARATLDNDEPDLLVTHVKLAAYNGLHLAIRLRSRGLNTPVIVIGDPDPVLQAEAKRHQACYLTEPLDTELFLQNVTQGEAEYRPVRRSPRKRVGALEALVDEVQARVLDVSYEGLRLAVSRPADDIPPYFLLRIPLFNVTCRAQRVWTQGSADDEQQLWCGASIVTADPAGAVAWRALVDAVPGWTLLVH